MFSNDNEIFDGLKQTGSVRRKAEDALFSKYVYFISIAQKQYSLNEDEIFSAYSDAVLKTIAKVTSGVFEGRSSLKTYMHPIFRNNCVDLLRKNSSTKYSVNRTESFTEILFNLSDPAKSVIQLIIEKTDIDFLKKKLNNIGNKCRDLLEMFLEGLTDKAIAEKLGYSSADVVRTSRGRCIDRLRQ